MENYKSSLFWGFIHKVCGLQLGPNFGVRPAADKDFYLRLTVTKMLTFVVFTDKCLRLCACSDPNFTVVVYYKNLKTEVKSEMEGIGFLTTPALITALQVFYYKFYLHNVPVYCLI